MPSEADLIAHIRSNTERIRAGTERICQETAERIAKIRQETEKIRQRGIAQPTTDTNQP